MNNGLARSIGMALLAVCVGVTASQSLAKCPRSCTAEFRKAFKACKVSCRTTAAPGQCRTACGQVLVEARLRCRKAENPTPPSCD